MSYSISRIGSTLAHDQDELDDLIQKSSLQITVVGVDLTQQIFIQGAISHQHNLAFLSFKSLRATIRYGTFSGQDLLLFLVPADRSHALRQVRIMKWIKGTQPALNLIPLIPSKAVWEAMRESLANNFPIYLPINVENADAGSFASRFREGTSHHFSQISEALAGPVFDSEATAMQLHKLNGQMQLKIAELRKQVLRLEQKLTLDEHDVRVQKPVATRAFQRSNTMAPEWRGDRYLVA